MSLQQAVSGHGEQQGNSYRQSMGMAEPRWWFAVCPTWGNGAVTCIPGTDRNLYLL
ncbi:MAG: hypothetical protein IPI88_16760 [Chitinophagaceae bacterium]|nr:hypothetical protein [Chitinophagaceae bacterium]